jgi:hypothetical protein
MHHKASSLSLGMFFPTRAFWTLPKITDPTVPNGRAAAFPPWQYPRTHAHTHSHTHAHMHTLELFFPRGDSHASPFSGPECVGPVVQWARARLVRIPSRGGSAVRRFGRETMVHLFIPITFSSLLLLFFTLFGVKCLGGSVVVVGDSPWRVYVLAQASQSSAFLWSNGGSGANDNGGTCPRRRMAAYIHLSLAMGAVGVMTVFVECTCYAPCSTTATLDFSSTMRHYGIGYHVGL